MIPRLLRSRNWGSRSEAYDRPLKLVVDMAAVAEDPDLPELLNFARHPEIELWVTQPPGSRIFIVGAHNRSDDTLAFRFDQSGRWGIGGVDNLSRYFADIPRILRLGLPFSEQDFEHGFALFAAAEEFGADAIITGGPLLALRDCGLSVLKGTSLLSASETLALIGLKLRTRRKFAIPLGSQGWLEIDRASSYWIVTRDGLPAGWRWRSAACAHSDGRLERLSSSAFVRVSRALRARDACQAQLQLRREPDFDEVLYHLDSLFVGLAGAMDASARVAHCVYGGRGGLRNAGWHKKNWIAVLSAIDNSLARLVKADSEGEASLACLHGLRNLIHEEALGRLTQQQGGEKKEFLTVPGTEHEWKGKLRSLGAVLLEATNRLGGASRWGVAMDDDGQCRLEPDLYIENLLGHCLGFLNQVMERTAIENHLPAGMTLLHTDPPREWHFNEAIHKSLGLLGGLGRSPAVLVH
jgi:hypothetical protein